MDNLAFNCSRCERGIVMNSRQHDESVCDEEGENWICGDCKTEQPSKMSSIYQVVVMSNYDLEGDKMYSMKKNSKYFNTLDKVKEYVNSQTEYYEDEDEYIIGQRGYDEIYPCNFDAFMKLRDLDGEELFIFQKCMIDEDNPPSFENPIIGADEIYEVLEGNTELELYISIKKYLIE